jgi:hypothetical protein
MNSVLDANGNPLTHVADSLSENEVWTFTVSVPCVAGMVLVADVPEDAPATVLARVTGSGDAFVDLAANPITLTEFDGETVDFDIRVEVGDVPGLARVSLPVRVTFNP